MPDTAAQRRIEDLLAGLNDPQREAVVHTDGPLLVLAGAGSGKTRVLTHRIAHLIHTGHARADEILAITFTNKAAQEMRERVELLVGRRIRAMWVMTFHSACARILRADAHRLGYTRQFTIYDAADSRRMIKRCLDELDVDSKRFTPRAMQAQISDAKNKLRSAEDYRQLVGSYFEQTVADVYEEYERQLHRANAMDFDDLLVRAVNLLELFQEVRDRYQQAFRHILVDEYQDTNHAQYRWLQLLASEHRNLMVVGDDDQCLVAGTPITMADGTTKPIEEVEVGDEVLACYGSGDFRPARVRRTHATQDSMGTEIRTAGGRRILSTDRHVHFAGYLRATTPDLHRVHLRAVQEHADAAWGRSTHDSEANARVEETTLLRAPHRVAQAFEARRRNVTVTLCGDRRGRTPMHVVAMGGRDADLAGALRDAGFSVRPAGAGWRAESCFEDYGDALAFVERIDGVAPVSVRRVARFGRNEPGSGRGNSLAFLPAASVRPGMAMFTGDGDYDVVESVDHVPLHRPVHDIDVGGVHNFVAGGLVTHNSIYGFRGADISNVLNFQDEYPDATIIRLEQNYRSTQTILSAANAVIANNRGRMGKELWTDVGEGDPIKVRECDDEHAEARFVSAEIERLVDEGVSRQEIAVFYRTNAQSRVLEDMLVRAGVGYQVIGGTKFYDRAEIKDAVAYLTFLVNPQDGGAFTRIANSPRRGIGQTSLSRVLAYANTMGITPWEAGARAAEAGVGTAAVKAFGRFTSTLERLRERLEGGAPVARLLEETLRETGYLEALEAERTIEAQGRLENLEELVSVAKEYDALNEDGSVAEFLQQIALLSEQDNLRDDEGLVTLMTLHNAKGLEYPIVFIIGCEDGVFPHSRALDEGDVEEERRLCYVGMTRAMRDLYLTFARRRTSFGTGNHYGLRSRFLEEIPRDLTDEPERAVAGGLRGRAVTSWARAAQGSAAAETAPTAVFAVGDDVVHAAFGEGVVTGVDHGGVIVVRFAGDGSERRLMADYAPIKRR